MGFSIGPLMNTQVEALISQFMAKHFPGCHLDGISEVTGHFPYTEYDVWINDNPIIHKVVLTNNWSPDHPSTDKVYLKTVILHSQMELVPDEAAWKDSEPIAYPDQVVQIETLCHTLDIGLPDIGHEMTYREAQALIESLVESIAFRDGKRTFRCSSCEHLDMTDRDISMPEHCYRCADMLAHLANDPFLPME